MKFLSVFAIGSLLQFSVSLKAPVFSLIDMGAAGDGVTDDTAALSSAIAAVAAAGGGSVLVDAGRRFLIAPVNLTSNMTLHVAAGATLLAIDEESRWPLIAPLPGYGQGRDHPGPRFTSMLHGESLRTVTISGDGAWGANRSSIDGAGSRWWAAHAAKNETFTRGRLLEFLFSSDVIVHDVALFNSPFWTTHFYDCDRVHVHHVAIEAPPTAPNTDGFDPDTSRDVIIEDSTYSGGDDCVAIKAGWDCYGVWYGKGTANILVQNLTCDGRYAGVAIGSEMSGGVQNITIRDVRFTEGANAMAHIKTGPTRGGFVTDVTFERLTAEPGLALGDGIVIDAYYGAPNPACPDNWTAPLPLMSRYMLRDIDGTVASISGNAVHLKGQDGAPITDVRLETIAFPPNSTWLCEAVNGTASADVTPTPCDAIITT